jgi:dTDP-glucose 4,6-dehydratase
MNWKGKKVFVTGAGGFIGSHLAERLTELGAVPRALVHYRADGSRGWLERSEHKNSMEIVAGDVCDRDCVLDAMRDVEVVFHLAALIAIPYSYHAPHSYVRTNIEGTLNVLQAARAHCVERVVHTSTSEVYGTARRVPIDELHPLQAQSPYAATKIAADKLAEAFHCSYNLPVVTVRPFNTFGPRQSSRAVVPTIITQCLNGGMVRLGNVDPTRDLNYVTDTVEGFIRAAAVPAAVGHTINLGSGREISVRDLAHTIGKLIGKPVMIETDEQRVRPDASEVERLVADSSLAGTLLQWTSRVPLEEGLRQTIEWVQANRDSYRPGAYVV